MFSTSKSPFVAMILLAVIASTSFAQQPQAPSQRFAPERNVPPSVHVPDAGIKKLQRSNTAPASYNFADSPRQSFGQTNGIRKGQSQSNLRQVSYQEPVTPGKNTSIPAVLRKPQSTNFKPLKNSPQNGKTLSNGFDRPVSKINQLKPPKDESLTAPSGNRNNIVVDKKQFASHQEEMQKRLEQLKRLRMKADEQNHSPSTGSAPQGSGVQHATFSDSPKTENKTLVANAVGVEPAMDGTTRAFGNVQQVGAESESIPNATMTMSTPGIRVESFGPDAIGVNKLATYKVTVTNEGNQDAEQIQIGLDLPINVDLQNIIVSTGHHEITDAVDQPRLLWTVERISVDTTHTIAVSVIPRTAEPFDMEVNWRFKPRKAVTQIRVTEPKLELKIAGPTEVQFGEKVAYDLTIMNPGTGDAEQVTVMLPEALGGQRATLEQSIPAGGQYKSKVELYARTAGQLNLATTAIADGGIEATASLDIIVRRANLDVKIDGPPMKYAGSVGQYTVTVSNNGDATASDVTSVLAMPSGVKYLGGIDTVEQSGGGLKWPIGSLTPGNSRTFKVSCQLDASGHLMFQAGARGAGDLAATHECQTRVDTIADLTLDVEDPKGPLPTGENVNYRIVIKNRGTRSANGVDLVMQFSEGIEPVKAEGFKHKIVTGQVIFSPITRIEPGQQVVLNVTAQALKSGTHIFRAQLTCEESDSREIGEGTTRFFGDDVATDVQHLSLPSKANTADASESGTNDFK